MHLELSIGYGAQSHEATQPDVYPCAAALIYGVGNYGTGLLHGH